MEGLEASAWGGGCGRFAGGEDECVADPVATSRRIGHRAHAAEVDLEVASGLTVGYPHRRALAPLSAAHLRPRSAGRWHRHGHASAAEQIRHLHRGETA